MTVCSGKYLICGSSL